MIIIDGKTTDMQTGNFANLEEMLVKAMHDKALENRVVTDVYVNSEAFSEIYPHQASDIDAGEVNKLEICSVSVEELAADVTTELYKVITLMTSGGKRVASLLRQADLGEGLEVLQDVLDVTRNFMGTVDLLRSSYPVAGASVMLGLAEKLSANLEEMSEVMINEDWLLLADLMEYEFIPVCNEWNAVVGEIANSIQIARAA